MKAIIFTLFAALATAAHSQELPVDLVDDSVFENTDGMAVTDVYATVSGNMGAVYMNMDNNFDRTCTLVSAKTRVAETVLLHTHLHGGSQKMISLDDGISIESENTHNFVPGGDHLMLMNLQEHLTEDNVFRLTLDFGDCGFKIIYVPVDNSVKY